jgi:hypothetical protein
VLVPVDLDRAGNCTRPALMAFVVGTEPSQVCGPARFASGVRPATALPGAVPATAEPAAPREGGQTP